MDRRAEIRSATSTAEFGGRVPGSEGWNVGGYLCGCLWSEQCGSFNITCAAVCGANSVAVSTLPVRLSVERTVWQFQHYLCGCLWSEQCGSFNTTCAAIFGVNSVAVSPFLLLLLLLLSCTVPVCRHTQNVCGAACTFVCVYVCVCVCGGVIGLL